MKLNRSHYTYEFLEHLNWIISSLESDSKRDFFVEKDWFDEIELIDKSTAKDIRKTVQQFLK